MGRPNLVIVESPTKGRTIERFLGDNFRVAATFGHIRDLPKKELGVDEQTFEPKYVVPPKARRTIKSLKALIQDSQKIYIATDLDREGEAIGWHVAEVTGLNEGAKKALRITFHEITKDALAEAMKNPRELNANLVNAQQARRILDRLVGYKLSPLLWKKITHGLSAGRVQSVAVRLIVDREAAIGAFKAEEYWTVHARLAKAKDEFVADLVSRQDKPLSKMALRQEKDAQKIIDELDKATFKVTAVKKEQAKKWPFPPFTTSTMQQEAARQLGWTAQETMRTAQSLYEKGFITYHRTDSVSLSWASIGVARKVIAAKFGDKYLPPRARQFKTKTKGAQEAHEAIRPAYADRLPEEADLKDTERRLYELIWRRMLASQMAEGQLTVRTVDLKAKNCGFRAVGSTLDFDGFTKLWPIKIETNTLPQLTVGDEPTLLGLEKKQHFTEPPPRYNMATLIKTLEEFGIGRPSTYAPIIATIIDRQYVNLNKGVFYPTDLGKLVTKLLVEHFPEIVDTSFTAKLEENLDAIAEGKEEWHQVLREFYGPFSRQLTTKQTEIKKTDLVETLNEKCPESGHPLIVRYGRFGKFIACSGFPECKYTRPFIIEHDLICPECGQGKVVERSTRRKTTFYGCSRYPECKWASWRLPEKTKA